MILQLRPSLVSMGDLNTVIVASSLLVVKSSMTTQALYYHAEQGW